MFYNSLERLVRLNNLIKMRATGTPKDLARKLDISERTLYEYLTLLKHFNAPLRYSKHYQSYYYLYKGEFYIGFYEKK